MKNEQVVAVRWSETVFLSTSGVSELRNYFVPRQCFALAVSDALNTARICFDSRNLNAI